MLPQLASSSSSSMHGTASLLLLIVIRTTSFFAGAALQPQNHHGGGCVPAERAALLSFKKGITKDRTNLLGSWHGEDCCSWRGIKCSKRTGHVIKLHLRNTNQDDDDSYNYYATCPDANALFDITSLTSLLNLNLSSNQLSGQIPRMIGAMQSLVSLDLSKNKISGEIPSTLSNLSSLSCLNLSYNNLSGKIPSGRQLDTLNVDDPSLMYIGNSGLCGPPLQKNCSGHDAVIHGHVRRGSKQEFEPMSFYFGLVQGLVAGNWMVFCAMLFKKTWRIAYFRFFDKLYDRIYVFVVVKWGSFARNTAAE